MARRERHLTKTKGWGQGETRPGSRRALLCGRPMVCTVGQFLQKLIMHYRAACPSPGLHPQGNESKCSSRNLHWDMRSSFVCENQKVEMTQMSISSMGSAPGRGKNTRGGSDPSNTPSLIQQTAAEHPLRSQPWAQGCRCSCEQKRDPSLPL